MDEDEEYWAERARIGAFNQGVYARRNGWESPNPFGEADLANAWQDGFDTNEFQDQI